jgi:hypothetical protein
MYFRRIEYLFPGMQQVFSVDKWWWDEYDMANIENEFICYPLLNAGRKPRDRQAQSGRRHGGETCGAEAVSFLDGCGNAAGEKGLSPAGNAAMTRAAKRMDFRFLFWRTA